jgi:release factor glutamine methyltransferase
MFVFCDDFCLIQINKLKKFYYENFEISKNKFINILEFVFRKKFFLIKEKDLTNFKKKKIEKIIYEIIEKRKPIEYIIGNVDFINVKIKVKKSILIPRVETEYWCDLLIKFIKKNNIENFTLLDIGTGSGCLPIAIAKNLSSAKIDSVDISKKAINLALENSKINKVFDKINFYKSNLFSNIKSGKLFDFIISNPPYICEDDPLDDSVLLWESRKALYAKDNGLFYIKKIILNACCFLSKNGCIFIECDSKNIFEAFNFAVKIKLYCMIKLIKDQYGILRVLAMACDENISKKIKDFFV